MSEMAILGGLKSISDTLLGPQEILAPLGAGGLGEVYKACDTWLGREVAIKVLDDDFAQNAERPDRSRFRAPPRTRNRLVREPFDGCRHTCGHRHRRISGCRCAASKYDVQLGTSS